MNKIYRNYILFFILGILVASTGVAYASYAILSSSVTFQPKNNSWEVDNVEDALDDLYELAHQTNGVSVDSFIGTNWPIVYQAKPVDFTVPISGDYKIELWGASGGSGNSAAGGKGAYVKGEIFLYKGDILHFYIGGVGSNGSMPSSGQLVTSQGGWNGGGSGISYYPGSEDYGCGAGGGATDVRIEGEDLNARIMVAGAGGGGNTSWYSQGYYYYSGGAGGSLSGGNGTGWSGYNYGKGGTQTSGGGGNNPGSFGVGANGSNGGSGGGAGYYGGGTSGPWVSAGGGSSYISGHAGCVAVKSPTDSSPREVDGVVCTDSSNSVECSIHYTGLYFVNTEMKSGSETMPTIGGESTQTGNTGNGHAKVTYLG